jgi:hypothetical protein
VLLTPLQHRELLLSGGDLRIELKVDRDDTIGGQLEVKRHLNAISIQRHAPINP